jgi:hypothetical protein
MRKSTLGIVIAAVLLILALGYNFRHVMTAPKCVEVLGPNRVMVEDAGAPFGVGSECEREDIRAYLVRYDFEKVGTRGIGVDYIYAR